MLALYEPIKTDRGYSDGDGYGYYYGDGYGYGYGYSYSNGYISGAGSSHKLPWSITC